MAVKYWIGGATTSNWNDNSKWSLQSGGANNTTAAISGDDAYFDAASGSGVVVVTLSAVATNIYFVHPTTGSYTGTLRMTNGLTAVNNFTLSAAMTIDGIGTLTKSGNGGTFTSNTKVWPNNFFTPNGSGWVTTFGDNWTILGSMIGTLNPVNINATAMRTITIGGSLTTGAAYNCTNITFVLNGTGTISGGISGALININSPLGAITQAALSLSNCTFTYTTAVSFTSTGSITISGVSVTLNNVASITFLSISFGASSGQALILNSNANTGNLFINGAQSAAINGAWTLSVSGNITPLNGLTGTALIEMVGPLAASIGVGSIQNNLNISKSGGAVVTTGASLTLLGNSKTLTMNSPVNFLANSTTLTLSGTLLTINNFIGSPFFNMTIPNGTTLILNGSVNTVINNNLTLSGNAVFQGTVGWTCNNLIAQAAAATITLQQAVTYRTLAAVNINGGTNAARAVMKSSDLVIRAIWILNPGAAQSLIYVNGTRIDSSGGQTVWSFGVAPADIVTSINWYIGTRPGTVAYTFVY